MSTDSTLTEQHTLSAEGKELRRKVILARLAVALVVLAIAVVCAMSQWSSSETGAIARAEFMLKSDHSRRNILDCLDIAERLARQGKKKSTERIESAVDQVLKVDSLDSRQTMQIYLELASELQKRGNNETAFDYAFKALKLITSISIKPNLEDTQSSLAPFLSSVDEASEIMLSSKRSLSKEQLKIALDLVMKQSAIIQQQSKGALLDLCLDSISSNSVPVSDEVLSCILAKDLVLARRAPLSELDKTLNKSIEAINKYQDSATIRPYPAPCLLVHLLAITDVVFERNRSAAQTRKYVQLADDILQKVDRAKQIETDPITLAYCCDKIARDYINLGEVEKALSFAREAVACRTMQDLDSAQCTNTLASALVLSGSFAEAEPIATNAYKFYKTQDKSIPRLLQLRSDCVSVLYHALVGLNKSVAAASLINSELKVQEKFLPATAMHMIDLYHCLFDYSIKHSQFGQAAAYAKRISEMKKYLQDGNDRIAADMLLIRLLAWQINESKLVTDSVVDALTYIKTAKPNEISQSWLDGFCAALNCLKRSAEPQVYAQTLELIQEGFNQQLNSNNAEPVLLARVVNDLGSSGEEQIADLLRSQATEKLGPIKASTFLSRSMDFVMGDGKDGAHYADPQHAIKVYLDLAHSMQSKGDSESASKYAFEALKIVRVLAARKPELKAVLLESTEDASTIMLRSKQAVTKEQWKVVYEVASLELENVQKEGKDHILDLTLQALPNTDDLAPPGLIACMFAKDIILAQHAQVSALNMQVNKTINALAKSPTMTMSLVDHLAVLADLLYQHHELPAAQKFLNMSKKMLEDLPEGQLAMDKTKLAKVWSKYSNFYYLLGDKQSALSSARESVALKPLQDATSGEQQLQLADRLIDTVNWIEAESVTLAVYRFAKMHTQTAEISTLRLESVSRLFLIMKQLHKDALAVSFVKEEIDSWKKPSSAQALQIIGLYKELASYFISREDLKSATDCLSQIKLLKVSLNAEQRSAWGRSGKESELLDIAVRLNDSKLVSESAMELLTSKDLSKADSIKLPQRWWSTALANFKKTGETNAYQELLNFVQQGFRQQLSKTTPDLLVLADVVNAFDNTGEIELASKLRNEAVKKLQAHMREAFLSKCNNKATKDINDDSREKVNDKNKPDEAKTDEVKPNEVKPNEVKSN